MVTKARRGASSANPANPCMWGDSRAHSQPGPVHELGQNCRIDQCFSDRLQLRWLPSHPRTAKMVGSCCVRCVQKCDTKRSHRLERLEMADRVPDEDNEHEDFAGNLQETVPEVSPPVESQDSNSDDNGKRLLSSGSQPVFCMNRCPKNWVARGHFRQRRLSR